MKPRPEVLAVPALYFQARTLVKLAKAQCVRATRQSTTGKGPISSEGQDAKTTETKGRLRGRVSPARRERRGMAALASTPAETILLVDDDPEVLSLAADILRGAGYAVLSTGDPREALRIARTRAESLHLLLTDVVMPLMSGRQLAEELRAIRSEVKVLFMSAYSIETVEDYLILLAPGEPFVVKPFTMAELKRKVRAALEYRSPFSQPRVSRDRHDHD